MKQPLAKESAPKEGVLSNSIPGNSVDGVRVPKPIWEEVPLAAPSLAGTTCADVAIIGGGFAGLSCARYLKEADPSLDIVLLERERIGSGASGRSAGILSPFPPITWLIDCTASTQRLDDIRFASGFIAADTHSLTRFIESEGIQCDLRPTRIITTGANGFYERQLGLIGERCLLAGLPGHLATRAELHAAVPYPAHGGYVLDGFAVQPLALVQGLGRYCRRIGVRVCENTDVTGLHPAGGRVEASIRGGARVMAVQVIVAANAYTHQLGLRRSLSAPRPMKTYLLATSVLDQPAREQLGLEDQTIVFIGGEYFYTRLWQGRLLFGGFDRPGAAAEPEAPQNASCPRRLRAQMVRRFPSLAEIAIDASWSGLYHETLTRVPIIGALASMPGVIANIGYGGVGLTLTQFSGRIAAGLVLGSGHRDPDADRMRAIYASTRYPIKEGMKFGWHLLRSLLSPGV